MVASAAGVSQVSISEVLSKIRTISAQSKLAGLNFETEVKPASSFSGVLSLAQKSLKSVSATQNHFESLKDAYLNGDSAVSLPQVLHSSIQSKVAFEGLLVVRNKLIESYKEIMNMPV